MKFKVGDRVLVRMDAAILQHYYMEGNIACATFVCDMSQYRGKVFTVVSADSGGYRLEGAGCYTWTDGMLGLNPVEFEVGDSVEYTGSDFVLKGQTGTVIGYRWNGTPLVEFDQLIPSGHSGNDVCLATCEGQKGRCWFCISRELKLIPDEQPKPECTQKIVIVSDGKESMATLYDGDKEIKSATATMPEGVDFDFMGCAKRALKQLDKDLKVAPEKEEHSFTGKVVCFETNVFVFSPGKMYDVIAGAIVNDVGNKWTGLHRSSGDTSSAIYQFSFEDEPYAKFIAITN